VFILRLLNVDEIKGSGFTLIASDQQPFSEKNQEQIDAMCDELSNVLEKYGFALEMVLENETAAKLQSRVMFKRYMEYLESGVSGNEP